MWKWRRWSPHQWREGGHCRPHRINPKPNGGCDKCVKYRRIRKLSGQSRQRGNNQEVKLGVAKHEHSLEQMIFDGYRGKWLTLGATRRSRTGNLLITKNDTSLPHLIEPEKKQQKQDK